MGFWQKLKEGWSESDESDVDAAKMREGVASVRKSGMRTKWFWIVVVTPFVVLFWNIALTWVFGESLLSLSNLYSDIESVLVASILLILTGYLPFCLSLYMDIKQIKRLDGVDWNPGLYRYLALSLALSPVVSAPIYLYYRSKHL